MFISASWTLFMVLCHCVALIGGVPKGSHLSVGNDSFTQRVIQWSSKTIENVTIARRNPFSPHYDIEYDKASFVTSNNELNWMQRAIAKNLEAGQIYDYRIGDHFLSKTLYFETWVRKTELGKHRSPFNLLFYGGIKDGQAKADRLLEEQALFGHFEGVVNLGAVSCNRTLVNYLDSLQDAGGTVVYLTTTGPNERLDNYTQYSKLFSMPGVTWPMDRLWYSFDTELAHFVSFSTEVYYPELDTVRIEQQLSWLRQDLLAANHQRSGLPDSRPWIIAYSHKALYCSGEMDCLQTRKRFAELETLFFESGVDLIISSQQDVYERTWPVYKDERRAKDYLNPRAPVHVTSAAFTCPEQAANTYTRTLISPESPEWSAMKTIVRGNATYGLLTIFNSTHLLWQENEDTDKQPLLDHFYLVQTEHGPFYDAAESGSRATTVILGVVIVLLLAMISGFLYLRIKAFLRRRRAEQKMSYVNLTSSLEL